MAIPCPGCGREYDVTLFQFGRTIHCTCGSRVGLEKRLGPRVTSSEPRFMLDSMLGGLARWLRVLGFDAAHDPQISDAELIRRGLVEERHILSRDRALTEEWTVVDLTILGSSRVEDQLAEVVGRFDLRERVRLFTRCTVCNDVLVAARLENVRERVPGKVLDHHSEFSRCPSCDRVYWAGSHTERMRRRVEEILAST